MSFDDHDVERTRPGDCSMSEWKARVQLASCYRVFHHKGWSEEIFNHITAKVPGSDGHYLINPLGLTYGEVTAKNLIKVDLAGRAQHPTEHPVNRAGFIIHSAVHSARPDAHCVMHTHNSYGLAVACKEGGLSYDNFYAAFLHGKVAYHDFEGVTNDEGEQVRLIASLGDKPCLILRNHGLLVAHQDIPNAYYWMYVMQRACEIQVLSGAVPGRNIPLTDHALRVSSTEGPQTDPQNRLYDKVFDAAVRNAGVRIEDIAG